jgi:hypothetical protein
MSWLQADIFFCAVRLVVALKTSGAAGGGNLFSRQADIPLLPASAVVLIIPCPSYNVIAPIKTHSGGSSGETPTLTTCTVGQYALRATTKMAFETALSG